MSVEQGSLAGGRLMARQSAKLDADRALVWHAQSGHACQASVIIADPPALMRSSGSDKE